MFCFLYHCQDFYRICRLIRSKNCLPFASTWVHLRFLGEVRVAYRFSLFCVCVVLLCVFTFWCPPVCSNAHALFPLFVFACAYLYPTHIVLCFCFGFSSSCALYVASFSGLPIFDCPFSNVYHDDRYQWQGS